MTWPLLTPFWRSWSWVMLSLTASEPESVELLMEAAVLRLEAVDR